MLGPGNELAARDALNAFPRTVNPSLPVIEYIDAFHIGGGINQTNASTWINEYAAEKVTTYYPDECVVRWQVIVTSAIFPGGVYSQDALRKISESTGTAHLVVDLRYTLPNKYFLILTEIAAERMEVK